MEWSGAANISAAGQALWNEWHGADWSMTAPFSHFFEEPPSRGDNVNMEDKGGMDLASAAVKAEEDARAAWALFQAEGTERAKRAKRQASKRKAVDNLESPSPKVAKQAAGWGSVNKNPSFWKTLADMAGSHATVGVSFSLVLDFGLLTCLYPDQVFAG
ncbi:hypothetical protein C0991_002983 [Blastosporella zonata]|nr:hypothetical protein C0991_002983 [Blastosporella zonata]